MLRITRIVLAIVSFLLVTLLFLDFTGWTQAHFGFMAKIQLVPAILAANLLVVVAILAATLLLGRVYCSVICPLGIMQDIVNRLRLATGKKARNRFNFSPALTALRWTFLVLFVVCLLAQLSWIASLIAPYSAYGRMVNTLLAPAYDWANNLLAGQAAQRGSYLFWHHATAPRTFIALAIAIATFLTVTILAWMGGRTWCNTVCPVGTLLGTLSRYSLLAPVINTDKCKNCSLCARRCKASCIDYKNHKIDYSRCVACFDCIDNCSHNAIEYTRRRQPSPKPADPTNCSRRSFLAAGAMVASAAAINAADKLVDGGMTQVKAKKAPQRKRPVLPPGAKSISHFTSRCTACQLCVTACPTQVLRPSIDLDRLMKPQSGFEIGYCRPECTRCANVCPTGAILPLSVEEKSSLQTGHAVWIKDLCVPISNGDSCGNCARHCPTGAITMVYYTTSDGRTVKVPAVDTERCIGCGACENLCPSRPYSAIYVEGNEVQKLI
ncbi:MAG: 4Fe-4S binding protein [Muribaculum sp.]|nr:4Fe-4S binding protein [Muribaculaceae bacterium]MCM1080770.1 4Fe-4S binding protein [Muribaculum sp.]